VASINTALARDDRLIFAQISWVFKSLFSSYKQDVSASIKPIHPKIA
jgi:hypothetical protein